MRTRMTERSPSQEAAAAAAEPCAGRPRCAETRQAILDAVWRLLQTTPLAQMSIELIAREAGVGKATIYRWWTSKAAVALEAFLARYLPETSIPTRGTAAQRLQGQLLAVVRTYQGEVARLAADIVAEGQSNPDVLKMFHEQFVLPRRRATRAVIEEGQASGEFDPTVDPELAMDLMYAPVYFRLLIRHGALDERFARQLGARAIRALLPATAPAALDAKSAKQARGARTVRRSRQRA